MSGIYIPGIEMPQNCICCDLSHEDNWCPAKQEYFDRYSYDTCPIIPDQQHGRLIDADEFLQRALGTRCFRGDYARMLEELVGESKTIIPAEGQP